MTRAIAAPKTSIVKTRTHPDGPIINLIIRISPLEEMQSAAPEGFAGCALVESGLAPAAQLIQTVAHNISNNWGCQWFAGPFHSTVAARLPRPAFRAEKAPKSVIQTIDSASDLA